MTDLFDHLINRTEISKSFRMTVIAVSGVILVALATMAGCAWYIYHETHREIFPGSEAYRIEKGSSLRDFAKQLENRHVITTGWSLLTWAVYRGQTRKIQAGEYRFDEVSSLAKILRQIIAGQVVTYPTTFIEGWTFVEIRQALEAAEHLLPDSVGLSDQEILAVIGSDYGHPEGLFFPDTYHSVRGYSQLSMLSRAYRAMEEKLANSWAGREPGLPLAGPYEALILASIIERESGVDEERGRISGVLTNRLRQNIPLQVDPTVIYGLGPSFDGDLRSDHLKMDGPYNTYRRRGLPPTPISNPGLKSLQAAVRPVETTDMFFVARGDGRHEFSETLEEHHRAVRRHQVRR